MATTLSNATGTEHSFRGALVTPVAQVWTWQDGHVAANLVSKSGCSQAWKGEPSVGLLEVWADRMRQGRRGIGRGDGVVGLKADQDA